MAAPPPRYRVVERGRRLEVVDRWAGRGRPASAAPNRSAQPGARAGAWPSPERIRFDGTAQLSTARWYDDRAPRTVKLTAERVRWLSAAKVALLLLLMAVVAGAIAWPGLLGLLVAPVVLANDSVRRSLRGLATGWLDRAAADWN